MNQMGKLPVPWQRQGLLRQSRYELTLSKPPLPIGVAVNWPIR